jgi:hypothetical protein
MSGYPIPIRPTSEQLAKRAYEAYAKSTENKTFDGRDMPTWDDLTQPVRNAWAAAGEQVRHDVLVQLRTGA